MSIFVVWEKPRRDPLHIVYRPGWSYEDFEQARHKARQMLDHAPQKLDLVIDQQLVRFSQADFLLHAELMTEITQHPKVRRTIVLGVPQHLMPPRRAGGRENSLFHNYIFAPSMDEAYDLLMTASV
jgi:hypothetical protein